jgi:hypothetical protein
MKREATKTQEAQIKDPDEKRGNPKTQGAQIKDF